MRWYLRQNSATAIFVTAADGSAGGDQDGGNPYCYIINLIVYQSIRNATFWFFFAIVLINMGESNRFWARKKVLVGGGLGFIGSHFVEELVKRGAYVICPYLGRNQSKLAGLGLPQSKIKLIKADLVRCDGLVEAGRGVDAIINCAAMDGNTEFKLSHAAQMMDVNIRIASNVLGIAKENNIKNVVLVSSAEVYSPRAKSPIKEEDDYQKYNDYTVNGYVLSKRYTEILGELYDHEYGMNVFLPRPANVYGPRDHFKEGSVRVIPSMIKSALLGKPIEIWGDGSQTRQFMYVKDLVRAVLKMVEENKFHKMNIAGDETVSILELAKLVCEISGTDENVHLDLEKPSGANNRVLNTKKLKSIVDFEFAPLGEGLKETVGWYKRNFK